MKLTGKTKEAFETHCRLNKIYFDNLPESCKNALIIEFFDSVDIWDNMFYYEYRKTNFQDYKKATNSALEKANEIFNLNK